MSRTAENIPECPFHNHNSNSVVLLVILRLMLLMYISMFIFVVVFDILYIVICSVFRLAKIRTSLHMEHIKSILKPRYMKAVTTSLDVTNAKSTSIAMILLFLLAFYVYWLSKGDRFIRIMFLLYSWRALTSTDFDW